MRHILIYTNRGKSQIQDRTLWIGLDVGAKSFHAAIDFPMIFEGQVEQEVSKLENREFRMTTAGVKSFLHWGEFKQNEFLSEYTNEESDPLPKHFLMEATGIYSSKLQKMLYAVMPDAIVIIANPEPIKAFRRSLNIKNKTDKADAQVIARYGRDRKPVARKEIPEEYQRLREYSRARSFLKDQRTAINNYHDNVENSLPKRMCTQIVKAIDKEIEGLDREIKNIVIETPEIKHEVEIMTSMPGIGMASAIAILGELGPLKNYTTREKLVAMAGLNPVKKQSGTSINQTHISKKGSPHIRRFLYMDTKTALPKIQPLQELYDRLLARGKTRLQARCAVMRKMLLILRGMIIKDKIFDENYGKNQNPA